MTKTRPCLTTCFRHSSCRHLPRKIRGIAPTLQAIRRHCKAVGTGAVTNSTPTWTGRGGVAAQLAAGIALAVASWLHVGCRSHRIGGEIPPDQAIHDLRREKAQLIREVEDLERKLELRVAQIDALEQQSEAASAHDPGGPREDLPMVVAIDFGRYSGPVDTDDDGQDDLIRIFVHTLDQEGRFLPVAGYADVQAVAMEPDRPPVVVSRRQINSAALNDAYRSSFMGTHYRIELTLPNEVAGRQVTVKVSITDARSGATVSGEQPMLITTATSRRKAKR